MRVARQEETWLGLLGKVRGSLLGIYMSGELVSSLGGR
jgi:hypothetical protein